MLSSFFFFFIVIYIDLIDHIHAFALLISVFLFVCWFCGFGFKTKFIIYYNYQIRHWWSCHWIWSSRLGEDTWQSFVDISCGYSSCRRRCHLYWKNCCGRTSIWVSALYSICCIFRVDYTLLVLLAIINIQMVFWRYILLGVQFGANNDIPIYSVSSFFLFSLFYVFGNCQKEKRKEKKLPFQSLPL